MKRSPFAPSPECSPGLALAEEVWAPGRGTGLSLPAALPGLGLGALGDPMGLVAPALGTERGEDGADLAGRADPVREMGGASMEPPEHNPGGSMEVRRLQFSRGTEAAGGGAGWRTGQAEPPLPRGTLRWPVGSRAEHPGNKWGQRGCLLAL